MPFGRCVRRPFDSAATAPPPAAGVNFMPAGRPSRPARAMPVPYSGTASLVPEPDAPEFTRVFGQTLPRPAAAAAALDGTREQWATYYWRSAAHGGRGDAGQCSVLRRQG